MEQFLISDRSRDDQAAHALPTCRRNKVIIQVLAKVCNVLASIIKGCFGIVKWVLSTMFGADFLNWMLIVLNLVVETCQAVLAQDEGMGKMSRQNYLTMSIITSSLSLMISLVEAYLEACSSGEERQPETGRSLDRFLLIFGMICSMVQLVINVRAKLGKDPIKFDYVSVLLAFGHLLAKIIIARRERTRTADTPHGETSGDVELGRNAAVGATSQGQTSSAGSHHRIVYTEQRPVSSPESTTDDIEASVPAGTAPSGLVDAAGPLLRPSTIP